MLHFSGLYRDTKSPRSLSSHGFILCCALAAVNEQPQLQSPQSSKHLLICRTRPRPCSHHLEQWGSACCHPPRMLLPVFSVCWTFTLYWFHSHFSSIMASVYLTTLLIQFLPLCNLHECSPYQAGSILKIFCSVLFSICFSCVFWLKQRQILLLALTHATK